MEVQSLSEALANINNNFVKRKAIRSNDIQNWYEIPMGGLNFGGGYTTSEPLNVGLSYKVESNGSLTMSLEGRR